MRIERELGQAHIDRNSVLTIGVFDGVHLGHQSLITKVIAEARAQNASAGVLTFRSHPDSVLNPNFQPQYITSIEERIRLIEKLGADFVVPVSFDEEVARLRARKFAELLRGKLRMHGLVVGPDFAMGYKREGNVDTLTKIGAELGFSVSAVDLLSEGGTAVRSTNIRRALVDGRVADAAKNLGRNFAIIGSVVPGEQRGRILGFPTANIEVRPHMAIPGNGIYATRAFVNGERYMAATSIGTRPTFDGKGRTIEAYLLGFDSNLYNMELRLEFVQRLRDELKFDSVDALLEQMELDVEQTRTLLQA
ncbi:MAG: bifunctional riboflavin kinase/FAD synthetase [Chloroflexota bacterium]|nr:bifunctional riboflavin kinase/FAD synthetase [Chloroflexota bacterium]